MFLAGLFFASALFFTVDARGGIAGLDSVTFDKVIPKFKTSLVKFDPINTNYLDKENTFRNLVRDFGETEDFLFAEVDVEEKDDFPKRFSMTDKDYPVLKLFRGGSTKDPITFDGEWTRKNILNWLRANSNVRFSLPSCLSSFDELAESFMASEPAERTKLLEEAKTKGAELEGKAKASADVYIKIMQMTLDRGNGFVASEEARVNNLLAGKLTSAKKEEFRARLNIIRSFVDPKELAVREAAENEKAEQEKTAKEKGDDKQAKKSPEKTQSKATQSEETPAKKVQEVKIQF